MSEIDRLEALLARVQRNRRPAPPDLAQVLGARSMLAEASGRAEPGAGAAPPRAVLAPAPTPAPAIASPVARKPAEPTPLEAALARSPAATPPAALASPPRAQPSEPEIDVVMEVEEEDVRTGEFEVPSDQEVQAAAERAEREEREAQQAALAEAEPREVLIEVGDEAPTLPQPTAPSPAEPAAAAAAHHAVSDAAASPRPIAATPPQASAPVARIARPLDTTPPTFGQLMSRTLALRPR